MAISDTITKAHIEEALKQIDESGVPEQYASTKYDLIAGNGRIYPPKYVMALAAHIANGSEIETGSFNSIEAKNYLEKKGYTITMKEVFVLTVTANDIVSTDSQFDLNNLGAGDDYEPISVSFFDENGAEKKRDRSKGERKISNQTLPKLAIQIYESNITQLTAKEKREFPVCKYKNKSMICGIFANEREYRSYKNTIEFLSYTGSRGDTFVIYCWNIFSTLYFVQECLKRFGKGKEKFVLTYQIKEEMKNQTADSAEEIIITSNKIKTSNISPNTILYGPPGTGKTYNTAIYAVAICDGLSVEEVEAQSYWEKVFPRYQELIAERRVVFTTFHQSYGYEDFIEGIKPVIEESNGKKDIYYDVRPGIFKTFCDDCDDFDDRWDRFVNYVKASDDGKIEISLDTTQNTIQWIADKGGYFKNLNYADSQTVDKETVKSIYEGSFVVPENNGTKSVKFRTGKGIIKKIDELFPDNKNKVFIIDEINRGNISKIFGELITLIEPGKRKGMKEAMSCRLPYSGIEFSVPSNVYIIGTMNTADRSIAQIDMALRRRFSFVEMMPDSEVLDGIEIDGIVVKTVLDTINKRIEALYDREHTIGHAYFTELLDESNRNLTNLARIFKDKIIPLLQEYFYEDYEKISLVLGDFNKESDDIRFIMPVHIDDVFDGKIETGKIYRINNELLKEPQSAAFIGIYQKVSSDADNN